MPPRKGDKPLTYCGVGLDVHLAARIDRLRAATGRSRSAVIGALIERAIGFAEAEHVNEIVRFDALASRAGQGWEQYAQAYAKRYASFTHPPTVETSTPSTASPISSDNSNKGSVPSMSQDPSGRRTTRGFS